MDYGEMFDLVETGDGRAGDGRAGKARAGDGHWIVKHAITGEPAGTLMTTSQGIVLRDQDSHFIGSFPTIERALQNLYAVV